MVVRQADFGWPRVLEGQKWNLVANPLISGGDPGAVKTRDGGLLVVITGESRLRPGGLRRGGAENNVLPTPPRRGPG